MVLLRLATVLPIIAGVKVKVLAMAMCLPRSLFGIDRVRGDVLLLLEELQRDGVAAQLHHLLELFSVAPVQFGVQSVSLSFCLK